MDRIFWERIKLQQLLYYGAGEVWRSSQETNRNAAMNFSIHSGTENLIFLLMTGYGLVAIFWQLEFEARSTAERFRLIFPLF